MEQSPVGARIAPFRGLLGDPGATLDRLCLAVSWAVNGDVDIDRCNAELDDLGATVGATVDVPTASGIVAALFASGRLVGDTKTYHHRDNSFLDRVLDRGRGMPITLSVVAIEVGRRLGVPIVGIGLPGHFVVGSGDDPHWFADPFRRGLEFDLDGCRRVVAGFGHRWSDSFVEPVPNRLIVARILNNLLATSAATGDSVTAAIVLQLRTAMPEFESERPTADRALHLFN